MISILSTIITNKIKLLKMEKPYLKIKILILLLVCLTNSGIMAQSAFKGLYIEGGIGAERLWLRSTNKTLKVENGPFAGTYPRTTKYVPETDFTGKVNIVSLTQVSKKFLLGIGIEFEPVSAGVQEVETTGQAGNKALHTYEQKSHFNFYLSPAFEIKKNKLVFAKVGYSQSHSDIEFNGEYSPDHIAQGFVLGLGYRQIIKKGFYFFGEAQYVHYVPADYIVGTIASGVLYTTSEKTSSTGIATYFGVGYKF